MEQLVRLHDVKFKTFELLAEKEENIALVTILREGKLQLLIPVHPGFLCNPSNNKHYEGLKQVKETVAKKRTKVSKNIK